MELAQRYFKINNYVLSTLNESRKSIVQYYINKYNPFYEWQIGSLKETEIKSTLSLYFSTANTGERIRRNIVNSIAFTLLLNSYKEIAGVSLPENLANDNWAAIRKLYETSCRKENETVYGQISYDEKFRPSNSESDLDKTIQALEITIEILVRNIHPGNWTIDVRDSENKRFQYRVTIVNCNIDIDVFEMAILALKNKFPISVFELKDFHNNNYIEGFIRISL